MTDIRQDGTKGYATVSVLNVQGVEASLPFYIWGNQNCDNKSSNFNEATQITKELIEAGFTDVYITDADGVEVEAHRWQCCNCMESSPHPDNECVLHALLTVLRERETHTEIQLEKLYINCNVDLLWDELGRVVNDLGNGRYFDDGQSLNSES